MSVLGKKKLVEALGHEDPCERLVVSPLLCSSQIGSASIDIRLGNDFVICRHSHLSTIDPGGDPLHKYRHHERRVVNFREHFVLHPQELVLGSTLEYFRLPRKIAATVTSRSSWGRAGLVIATATAIHPGFTGTITLELLNHGKAPMKLFPGFAVAQMVFFEASGAAEYEGKFSDQVGAKDSSIQVGRGQETEFWCGSVASRNSLGKD